MIAAVKLLFNTQATRIKETLNLPEITNNDFQPFLAWLTAGGALGVDHGGMPAIMLGDDRGNEAAIASNSAVPPA